MPLAELPHRARESLLRSSYRRRPPPLVDHPHGDRDNIGLAVLIGELGRVSGVEDYWHDCADALQAGAVQVFNLRWHLVGGLPVWREDPVTGHLWPNEYCFS